MADFADTVGKNWDGTLSGATGAVTYSPSVIDPNGVAHWVASGAVYDADKKLSMSVRRPTKGSQVIRVQVKLVHPLMDSVDTTLKIGDCLANVELVFPKRADETARYLLVGHLLEFLHNGAAFAGAIDSYESVY